MVAMDDSDRKRYSRHIQLPQIGESGQRRLLDSRVLIVGVGGLGSPASMYLASAGIGCLVLSDFDRVDESNLQRQIVHTTHSIGREKAFSAKTTLSAINPGIEIVALDWALDTDELQEQANLADVVLDCSDNFETRFEVNRVCVKTRTPLVSGAAIRMDGQVSTYRLDRADSPCYRCLYGDVSGPGESCAAEGILAPVVGIIGTIQALEAIKIITGVGKTLNRRLLLFDGAGLEFQTMTFRKDPECTDCSPSAGAATA
jgi:adenylyltransferase/sulfurtransferase